MTDTKNHNTPASTTRDFYRGEQFFNPLHGGNGQRESAN